MLGLSLGLLNFGSSGYSVAQVITAGYYTGKLMGLKSNDKVIKKDMHNRLDSVVERRVCDHKIKFAYFFYAV